MALCSSRLALASFIGIFVMLALGLSGALAPSLGVYAVAASGVLSLMMGASLALQLVRSGYLVFALLVVGVMLPAVVYSFGKLIEQAATGLEYGGLSAPMSLFLSDRSTYIALGILLSGAFGLGFVVFSRRRFGNDGDQ